MHLGNGAITPECGIVALGLAVVGAGIAVSAARAAGFDQARARTAGALGAAVFAAQLFNVPLLPYSSVHLIGGVLLAWVLGPALGLLTMICILTLQAALLGDGGFLSLGANIINMGLVPTLAVVFLHRMLPTEGTGRTALKLGGTAIAATVIAAGLVVLEVAVGRSSAQLEGIGAFASQMLWSHLVAGVVEGVATVAILAAFEALLRQPAGELSASHLRLSGRACAIVAAASVAIAVLSAPTLGLASSAPDGYEAALDVLRNSGAALGSVETTAAGSGITSALQAWQESVAASFEGLGSGLFVLATALAGAMAWGCASTFSRGRLSPVR